VAVCEARIPSSLRRHPVPTKDVHEARPGPPRPSPTDFNALYERHSRELWAATYARCLDANSALDIAQEAFLRLWQQWRSGQKILNPRGWLLRVARNLAEDQAKSCFRRNGTHSPQQMDEIGKQGPLPAELLERQETFARLREVLGQMSEADRRILTMRYALECSPREIARQFAVNPSAIHMRLSRARQRLGRLLVAQNVYA
jgi:RNA polymerase sigma-70 factor, ECF subfamily